MRSHSDEVRSDVYRIPRLIGESESLYNCKMHDLSSFSRRSHFLNRLLDTGLVLGCARAGLASLQDTSRFGSRVRWSFRRRPGNDHRLPAANPAGLDWLPERYWETSRTPAPAHTNPSLMQRWLRFEAKRFRLTSCRREIVFAQHALSRGYAAQPQ